ncbi:unnamed protein product, partial [Symbiodinium sp. KB8]
MSATGSQLLKLRSRLAQTKDGDLPDILARLLPRLLRTVGSLHGDDAEALQVAAISPLLAFACDRLAFPQDTRPIMELASALDFSQSWAPLAVNVLCKAFSKLTVDEDAPGFMDTMEPVLPGQPGFPAWLRVSLSILLFRPPPAGTRPRTGGIHPVAGAMHIAGVPLPPPPSQDQTGASAVPAAARAGLTSRQAEAFTAADLGADVDLQAARHRVLAVWALSAPRWPPAERLRVALAASSDPHHKTKGLATSLLKQLPPLFLASPTTAAELHRALLGTAQASDQ